MSFVHTCEVSTHSYLFATIFSLEVARNTKYASPHVYTCRIFTPISLFIHINVTSAPEPPLMNRELLNIAATGYTTATMSSLSASARDLNRAGGYNLIHNRTSQQIGLASSC